MISKIFIVSILRGIFCQIWLGHEFFYGTVSVTEIGSRVKLSSRSFYPPHRDESPFSMPLLHGIGLFHIAGISEERLAKGKINETRLGEMLHDLAYGVKGRVLVKDALVPALQVLPAERTLAIDEPDDERAPVPEHPVGLMKRKVRVVQKADRGHHERKIELSVPEWKLLGDAEGDLDSLPSGEFRHRLGRLYSSFDPEGRRKPAGPDADLDSAPSFRQEVADRVKLGHVRERMVNEPLLVLVHMLVKGLYARHSSYFFLSSTYSAPRPPSHGRAGTRAMMSVRK